jgi:hypothetical protein
MASHTHTTLTSVSSWRRQAFGRIKVCETQPCTKIFRSSSAVASFPCHNGQRQPRQLLSPYSKGATIPILLGEPSKGPQSTWVRCILLRPSNRRPRRRRRLLRPSLTYSFATRRPIRRPRRRRHLPTRVRRRRRSNRTGAHVQGGAGRPSRPAAFFAAEAL